MSTGVRRVRAFTLPLNESIKTLWEERSKLLAIVKHIAPSLIITCDNGRLFIDRKWKK